MAWPAPEPPTSNTRCPSTARTGRARSSAALSSAPDDHHQRPARYRRCRRTPVHRSAQRRAWPGRRKTRACRSAPTRSCRSPCCRLRAIWPARRPAPGEMRAHDGPGRQHADHDIRAASEIAEGRRGTRLMRLREFLDLSGSASCTVSGWPARPEVGRHARAHGTDPDKADAGFGSHGLAPLRMSKNRSALHLAKRMLPSCVPGSIPSRCDGSRSPSPKSSV